MHTNIKYTCYIPHYTKNIAGLTRLKYTCKTIIRVVRVHK